MKIKNKKIILSLVLLGLIFSGVLMVNASSDLTITNSGGTVIDGVGAFDSDMNTYSDLAGANYITSDTDLANKKVEVTFKSNSNTYSASLRFLDSSNKILDYVKLNEDGTTTQQNIIYNYTTLETFNVIAPEGTAKIYLGASRHVYLYDLKITDVASKTIDNIQTDVRGNEIDLTFTKDEGITNISLLNDNKLVDNFDVTNTNSINLKGLKSNTTYNFTLIPTFSSGAGQSKDISLTTLNNDNFVIKTNNIETSIFNYGAFDSDMNTYSDLAGANYITSDTDLANKKVEVTFKSNSNTYSASLRFLDSSNKILDYVKLNEDGTTTQQNIIYNYTTLETFNVIAPEGTAKIYLGASRHVYLYDLKIKSNSVDYAIEEAINNPTPENINTVWQAIFTMEDEDEKESKFNEFLENDTVFEDAYNQVLLAKETLKRTDIVDAIDKVEIVSDSNPYKNGLETDNASLKFKFNKKLQYGDFDKLSQYYVDKAEEYPTIYYVDRANYFTNLIDNEAQRAELMTRVNVIADKMYSTVDRFALEVATKYVQYAELYNKQDLIDKATLLVNALDSSTYKTDLLNRLGNL